MSTTVQPQLFSKRDTDDVLVRTLPCMFGAGVFLCMALAFLVDQLFILGVFGPVALAFMVMMQQTAIEHAKHVLGITTRLRHRSWKTRSNTWDMRPRR